MGKKKSDERSTTKISSKDSKKEKFSVTAILAGMDQNKASSSKAKPAQKDSSYIDNSYLPPHDEEEDEGVSNEERRQMLRKRIQERKQTQHDFPVVSDDKKQQNQQNEEILAPPEALEEDKDAFNVVIGSKTSVLKGEGNTKDANVKDIKIDSFSVSVRGKVLLENASVTISHEKRYGLVGPNGKGKSTLLKLLAWRKIPVPKNIDILLVEQEMPQNDKSALEEVVSANEELIKLREEIAALEEEDDDDNGRLVKLYERLNELDSDVAEAKACKILSGLGFTEDMIKSPTKKLSGGWRMRISLARALFMRPKLLLLDEPTNHLDLRAVLWLQEYLCRWKDCTLVVVSHGADFLNSVCTDIIHLHDQKLHYSCGDFDAFKISYDKRRKDGKKEFEIHEKKLKAAMKSGNKAQQDKVKAEEAPKPWRDYNVVLDFPEPTELTSPLLQLIDVSFSYPTSESESEFRLSKVDVGIDMGTRVAIVGPNGAGKSTLLKLIAGDLVLRKGEGEVIRSQKLRIGTYSQHFVDKLSMNETPVKYLIDLHGGKEEAVRAKLGKFGLPGENHLIPIVNLSGGQKARVVLTEISMSKPHILVLDEPTNHLDMETVDALGNAINEFKGGVVLASHDSRLVSRVCEDEEKSEIWVVKEGTVRFFEGTFDEYKEKLEREIKEEIDELDSLFAAKSINNGKLLKKSS